MKNVRMAHYFFEYFMIIFANIVKYSDLRGSIFVPAPVLNTVLLIHWNNTTWIDRFDTVKSSIIPTDDADNK